MFRKKNDNRSIRRSVESFMLSNYGANGARCQSVPACSLVGRYVFIR